MPGQVNWVEIPAADTAKARTFYGGLSGWGTSEFGGDYHVIDNGPAGAITTAEDGFAHPRVYFATVHAMVDHERARFAGARVHAFVPILVERAVRAALAAS